MGLRTVYGGLGQAARLTEAAANEIVAAARPRAAIVLGPTISPPDGPPVTARLVDPAAARGGSLIPAWPIRRDDGSATIELVADWGALLAAWRTGLDEPADATTEIDALVASRERLWVGIANDVLQPYVPDPPAGSYSMVRHHALMLAAATLWMGPDRARRWQRVHALAGQAFLRRLDGLPLWEAVERAERGLERLLADPRCRASGDRVVDWLADDREAADAYRAFLGAAGLGVAALLETVPDVTQPTDWLRRLVFDEHPWPGFNRTPIEAFARRAGAVG